MATGVRYHIVPRTGEPVACEAKIKCPYGDIQKDHYGTRGEAAKAYERRLKALLLPSNPGRLPVTALPDYYRQSPRGLIVPRGMYFLGDPAVLLGEGRLWRDWASEAQVNNKNLDAVGALVSGVPVAALRASSGVGNYSAADGTIYGVTSGFLGLAPLHLLKSRKMSDEDIKAKGSMLNLTSATLVEESDGALSFGPHVTIARESEAAMGGDSGIDDISRLDDEAALLREIEELTKDLDVDFDDMGWGSLEV